MFPTAHQWFLEKLGSDHKPVLVEFSHEKSFFRERFRFDKRWAEDPSFLQMLTTAWNTESTDPSSSFNFKAEERHYKFRMNLLLLAFQEFVILRVSLLLLSGKKRFTRDKKVQKNGLMLVIKTKGFFMLLSTLLDLKILFIVLLMILELIISQRLQKEMLLFSSSIHNLNHPHLLRCLIFLVTFILEFHPQ